MDKSILEHCKDRLADLQLSDEDFVAKYPFSIAKDQPANTCHSFQSGMATGALADAVREIERLTAEVTA